jgi:hypothetical protein
MLNRNHLIHILKQHRILEQDDTLNIKFNKRLIESPTLLAHLIESTSFLRGTVCNKTRLHVLLQNIMEQPTCIQCGQNVKMRLSGRERYTFPKYCSTKCIASSAETKAKRLQTNSKKSEISTPLP